MQDYASVYIQSLITRELVEHFTPLKKVNRNKTCSKNLAASTQRVLFLPTPHPWNQFRSCGVGAGPRGELSSLHLFTGPSSGCAVCPLRPQSSPLYFLEAAKWPEENGMYLSMQLGRVHSCGLRQLYENLGNVGSLCTQEEKGLTDPRCYLCCRRFIA